MRQAVSQAVDVSGLVRATYHEVGVPAKNYLPPVLGGLYYEVAPYRYDPEQAQRLLADRRGSAGPVVRGRWWRGFDHGR